MRLLVRTDGGKEIGLGNVYRTLALLQQFEHLCLVEKTDILFLTGYNAQAAELVASHGYRVEHIGRISLEAEIAIQREWARRWQPHCAVVDVPEAPDRPPEFFEALRWSSDMLVVNLSDCNSGRHKADLVVEGDIYHCDDPVARAVGQRPRYLRGPKYWIVNPAFASERDNTERNLSRSGILISFGGSDPARLNYKIASLADHLSPDISPVTLVVGRGVDHTPTFPPDWHILQGVSPNQMAKAMHEARVGILSGGLTMYEAACVGLPALIIAQNVGQELGAQTFARFRIHNYLGRADEVEIERIARACEKLYWDREEWQRKSAQGMNLVDGLAAKRIIEAIIQEMA